MTRQCPIIETRCLSRRTSSSCTYALLEFSNVLLGINLIWTLLNSPDCFRCLRWQHCGGMAVYFLMISLELYLSKNTSKASAMAICVCNLMSQFSILLKNHFYFILLKRIHYWHVINHLLVVWINGAWYKTHTYAQYCEVIMLFKWEIAWMWSYK